jgi:site-specific DNA-methyltransferase (adenine-specific)
MYNLSQITNAIVQGHVLSVIKQIPSSSIDMVITSPPYYGLRNYNTNSQIWDGNNSCNHEWQFFNHKSMTGGINSPKIHIKDQDNYSIVKDSEQAICSKCGAYKCELGAESNFHLYIDHLIQIFDETKRILKPTGSCWINLGDCYSGSGQGIGGKPFGNKGARFSHSKDTRSLLLDSGVNKKSLIGIPDRLKIAMIDNGYICRGEIIWQKPNQMPQSAKDRFTVDFEKLYWFTKNKDYYFEQQFEPYVSIPNHNLRNKAKEKYEGTNLFSEGGRDYYSKGMRNKRSVWSINTTPLRDLHFATFPEKLVETPILACCPENGIVLDPFMGSGTTALVAKKLNRNYLGIELNPEYIEIAERRISQI